MISRRSFIKKAGVATSAVFSAPYILPSGRLFASTGARRVNHVVFCLFAGGVRNLESIQKAEGNLMPNIVPGTESITGDIIGSMSALPTPFTPLQNFGTLFSEFRYSQGATGHYNAHASAITGVYNSANVNIALRPPSPTVFEYYRKHSSPDANALNAWWVSNALGPYPALNYSNYPGYGANYGANFIQPSSIFSGEGYQAVGSPKSFSSDNDADIDKIRGFLDQNFSSQFNPEAAGISNSLDNRNRIENFITGTFEKAIQGAFVNPWNLPAGTYMNGDMVNIIFAEEIIKEFQPELMVVNMQDVDVCHTNFSAYCDNLRKADYALGHLWNTIQSTPGMADDTILIAAPEHGRNMETNTVIDTNGRFAIDHTNTPTAREIFCLMAGPSGVINQNNVITQEVGESIDIVPTIANILGFDSEIPGGLLPGRVLQEAFI